MSNEELNEFPPFTHLLGCAHSFGGNRRRAYYMPCNILGITKSGKIKIEVYGERNWNYNKQKRQIRYVARCRLVKAG